MSAVELLRRCSTGAVLVLTDAEVRTAALVAGRFHDALQQHILKHHCAFMARVCTFIAHVCICVRMCVLDWCAKCGLFSTVESFRLPLVLRASASPRTSGKSSCGRWTGLRMATLPQEYQVQSPLLLASGDIPSHRGVLDVLCMHPVTEVDLPAPAAARTGVAKATLATVLQYKDMGLVSTTLTVPLRNAWIVKPNHLSKGNGIQCFNNAFAALRYARELEYAVIGQKYIERPLLVKGRKVRVEALVGMRGGLCVAASRG